MHRIVFSAIAAIATASASADSAKTFDPADAFGALPSVSQLRLSADGKKVSYIAPAQKSGNLLYTYDLSQRHSSKPVLSASGKPERLTSCYWVSNERLVCEAFGIILYPEIGLVPFSRLWAMDRDGSHLQLLTPETNEYTRGYQVNGGRIIDWSPDEDGAVLMTRAYLPNVHTGSRVGSAKDGLGVDHVDTRSLKVQAIEPPFQLDIPNYIADGRGNIRVVEHSPTMGNDESSGIRRYSYRVQGSRDWLPLSP